MSLAAEFTQALEQTIEIAKEHKYTPTLFMQMLREYGGVETAKRLLANKEAQTGLYKLWELDLLRESMEAVVLRKKFESLFTEEELAEAHRRLKELGYFK
ncbi:MAG: hypothetical protein ACOYYJ_15105 [Chloroflexota bacterium]